MLLRYSGSGCTFMSQKEGTRKYQGKVATKQDQNPAGQALNPKSLCSSSGTGLGSPVLPHKLSWTGFACFLLLCLAGITHSWLRSLYLASLSQLPVFSCQGLFAEMPHCLVSQAFLRSLSGSPHDFISLTISVLDMWRAPFIANNCIM